VEDPLLEETSDAKVYGGAGASGGVVRGVGDVVELLDAAGGGGDEAGVVAFVGLLGVGRAGFVGECGGDGGDAY
jgi:hypothetical protein